MSRRSRMAAVLRPAALAATLLVGVPGLAWAQAPGPDTSESDADALREYNAFAARQAARAGVAMLKSGYTRYAVTELEKAVRLAPQVQNYRTVLAVARKRLAAETAARQRRAGALGSGGEDDSGIQIPGFEMPATVAGPQDGAPGAGSLTGDATGDSGTDPALGGDTAGAATGPPGGTAGLGIDGSLVGAGHYNVPLGVVPGVEKQPALTGSVASPSAAPIGAGTETGDTAKPDEKDNRIFKILDAPEPAPDANGPTDSAGAPGRYDPTDPNGTSRRYGSRDRDSMSSPYSPIAPDSPPRRYGSRYPDGTPVPDDSAGYGPSGTDGGPAAYGAPNSYRPNSSGNGFNYPSDR